MRTLTPAELDIFNTEGFVVIPDFFTATEVVALQADVADLQANGKLRNVVVAKDGTTSTTSTTSTTPSAMKIATRSARAFSQRASNSGFTISTTG